MNSTSITADDDKSKIPTFEQTERLIGAVERLDRRFDEFCRVYLNARFAHGKPVDRWRRSA